MLGKLSVLGAITVMVHGGSSCVGEAPVFVPVPEDPALLAPYFGHGVWDTNPRDEALRELPLLTIIVKMKDVEPLPEHDQAFFERVNFGPGFPNLRDYFLQASRGRFTFRNAGVIGPVIRPDDPSTPGDESVLACSPSECSALARSEGKDRAAIIRQAAAEGFDFGLFDVNSDGRVDHSELAIVLVGPAPDDRNSVWGNVRTSDPICVTVREGLCVEGKASAISEHTSFFTSAHELGHLIGGIDLYGPAPHPGMGSNYGMSLMGGGSSIGGNDPSTVYPDPWHRMNFGWVMPRFHEVGSTAHCYWMDSVERGGEPLLVYSRESGYRDFQLLEYRAGAGQRSAPAHTLGAYDQNVFVSGLAAWSISLEQPGVPRNTDVVYTVQDLSAHLRILERPVESDDLHLDLSGDGQTDTVYPGDNRVFETRMESGVWMQAAHVLIMPPNRQSQRWTDSSGRTRSRFDRFGKSGTWTENLGEFALEAYDSNNPIVWVRVAKTPTRDRWMTRLAVALSGPDGQFPRQRGELDPTQDVDCWNLIWEQNSVQP